MLTKIKCGLILLKSLNLSSGDRILSDGPSLNISRLSRSDVGIFTCEAVNSQGSSTTHINVDVQCECIYILMNYNKKIIKLTKNVCSVSASVLSVSENIIVNTNEDATLSCTATGKNKNENSLHINILYITKLFFIIQVIH